MNFNSLLLCGCVPGAAIPTIPADTTIERCGQIQKIGIQRTKNGTAVNWITISTANPNLLATWNALKTATDSTKVQFSPYIYAPTNEVGGKIETGGGNEGLGGIPTIVGSNPSPFTAKFQDTKQSIIKEIKKLGCEKEISIFLVNECGNIIGLTDDTTTPTKFRGIPVRAFFVSDKKLGGFEGVDSNDLSWLFLPNWSDNLHIVTPTDFDALAQLS